MGNTYPDRQKDEEDEKGVICSSEKSHELVDHSDLQISNFKEWTLAKGGKPGRTLVLKLVHSETCDNWVQELFLKRPHGLGISIPKQLISLEGKYLKRCLELIQVNALQGAACARSVNLSHLDMGFGSDCTNFEERNAFVPKFALDYPVAVGTGDLVLGSEDEGIVGSIMGSNSMMSILNNPLFQRLGNSDHDGRFGGTKLFENKRSIPSDHQGSPGRFTMSPSLKLGYETSVLKNRGHTSDSVQRSPLSESNEAFLADQSSTSSSSQGMLQCTWDKGLPHFAFSLDDEKELYVANAGRAEVIYEKALDYVYSFHFKASAQKLSDMSGIESDLIGKMRVSSSFSLCSGNSKVMETEFVLVGTNDNHAREIHTFSRNGRRSRKLSKVMDMFKPGHSIKHRTPSTFVGSSAIPEDFSEDRGIASFCNGNLECRPELSENDFLPNSELAAIMVKDHIQDEDHQQEEVGGWGLKFLKKAKVKPTGDPSDYVSAPSECCQRNAGNCSTSMDIIVSAGPHGGPRTRDGGPSSLVERWRASGHCDCGGWDIGCPLKILKARPRSEQGWPNSESHEDCKSFDMFTEGSEQGTPTIKMVYIRDGLFFISFQPSLLSALQCFAIAVATIHSKSPSLRPKPVQD